jgi:hypothetical protein
MNGSMPENGSPSPVKRERNQVVKHIHQHQIFWQVSIPMIAGFVIALILAVLTVVAGPMATSQMADASIIILSGPMLLVGLISLALLGGTIYGVVRLIYVLPFSFYQIHQFLLLLGGRVSQVNNSLVGPVIRVKGFTASTRAFGRSLRQVIRVK